MNASPFIYGVAVSGNSFTNREQELDKLMTNLLGGNNTIIISPISQLERKSEESL